MNDFFELYNRYRTDPRAFAANSGITGMTEKQARDIIKAMDRVQGNKASTTTEKLPTDKGFFENMLTKSVAGLQTLIKTQEAGGYFDSLNEELITTDDVFSTFFDKQNKEFLKLEDVVTNLFDKALSGVETYFRQQTLLLEYVNKQAGLTGQLSKDFREEISKANPALLRMGISYRDLAESAVKLVQQTGKFALINQQTFERAGTVATAYVGMLQDVVAMYPEFEKVGIGAADANEKIGEAGKRSLDLGLQSQKVTKDLSAQLGKLNEYGFKNGVRGLEEMVRKSIEFRQNLDNVFKIAEDVMSPEKAIDLSANLQVLGGAIGDFNDPLKLMYMATNNVEGLQDALIGAASSLATYNSEQGKFELTGVNLRRAKAMAAELGITLTDLSKTAIAAAERTSATGELLARGLTLDEDQQRFITNLAQMKGGKMTIELQSDELKRIFGANEVALEDLDQNQAELLLRYQDEFKKLSDSDIVRSQATNVENIKRDVNFLAATVRLQAGKAIETAAKLTGFDLADVAKDTKRMGDETVEWVNTMVGAFTKLGITGEELANFKKLTPKEPSNVITTDEMVKKEEEIRKNTQPINPNETITPETLQRLITNVYTQAKYMDRPQIVVNNSIEETNPNSYTQVYRST